MSFEGFRRWGGALTCDTSLPITSLYKTKLGQTGTGTRLLVNRSNTTGGGTGEQHAGRDSHHWSAGKRLVPEVQEALEVQVGHYPVLVDPDASMEIQDKRRT